MTFWSDHRGIIYGVRTIRVYELIQDLPYFSTLKKRIVERLLLTCIQVQSSPFTQV